MNGSSHKRRTVSRALSLLAALTAFGLAVFHFMLLWRRVVDASISDPAVIARWIVAAILTAGLFAARKQSRRGHVVLWVLVALLHASIPAEERTVPIPMAVVAQIGFTAISCALLTVIIASLVRPPSPTMGIEIMEMPIAPAIASAWQSIRPPPAV